MPAATVGFQALGVHEAEAWLQEIAESLADMTGSKDEIDAALRSAYTERWRRWAGRHETGRLMQSFTVPSGSDAIRRAHRDSIEFGSTVEYGVFHFRALTTVTPSMQKKISEALLDSYVAKDPFGRAALLGAHG